MIILRYYEKSRQTNSIRALNECVYSRLRPIYDQEISSRFLFQQIFLFLSLSISISFCLSS